MLSQNLFFAGVGLVALQRVAELVYSKRNEKAILAGGGNGVSRCLRSGGNDHLGSIRGNYTEFDQYRNGRYAGGSVDYLGEHDRIGHPAVSRGSGRKPGRT